MNNINMNINKLCPNRNFAKPLYNNVKSAIQERPWIGKYGPVAAGVVVGGAVGVCVLPALGFGTAGVTASSIAASVQGPATAAGSAFAICQSLGATGQGMVILGGVGAVTGGVIAATRSINKKQILDGVDAVTGGTAAMGAVVAQHILGGVGSVTSAIAAAGLINRKQE